MTKMTATPIHGKNPLRNLLQNQKASDLETWYVSFGMWAYQVCSNDDPKMTLTYLISRSNLLPNRLNGNCFEKLIFEYCGGHSLLDMFSLLSINKLQRSRLAYKLSTKVAHIRVPSTY